MQAVQFRVCTPYVEKKSRTHCPTLRNTKWSESSSNVKVKLKLRQCANQVNLKPHKRNPGKRKHETPNRTFNSGSRDLQKTFLVRALATLLIGVCTY